MFELVISTWETTPVHTHITIRQLPNLVQGSLPCSLDVRECQIGWWKETRPENQPFRPGAPRWKSVVHDQTNLHREVDPLQRSQWARGYNHHHYFSLEGQNESSSSYVRWDGSETHENLLHRTISSLPSTGFVTDLDQEGGIDGESHRSQVISYHSRQGEASHALHPAIGVCSQRGRYIESHENPTPVITLRARDQPKRLQNCQPGILHTPSYREECFCSRKLTKP